MGICGSKSVQQDADTKRVGVIVNQNAIASHDVVIVPVLAATVATVATVAPVAPVAPVAVDADPIV
jgi:hypothetical protein